MHRGPMLCVSCLLYSLYFQNRKCVPVVEIRSAVLRCQQSQPGTQRDAKVCLCVGAYCPMG